MEIKNKRLDEIKEYENNPRKNAEAVKYVFESIKQFGFKVPIVIDKNGVIVAGHTRYKAAKKLKMKEVPCIVADDLTDEQVRAFRLADNKVAEKAEWDFDLLSKELNDLFSLDMARFGFEDDWPEDEASSERKEVGIGDEVLQLIIDCDSEEDMQEKYEIVTGAGIECRVSTL